MIKTTPLQDRIDPKTGKPKALQHNENDAENEKRVIQVLWDTQGIKLHPYATYSPIDYWMEKNNAVIGFAELKTSFLDKNQFAYLNARKYVNLQMAACGFNCKAYFITQRIDGSIYICDVNNLQGQIKIIDRGLNGKNEREPVKAVPLNSMYKLI
tara:strand:- start:372 stop:836 length:465 start_codon:yes stop_codon:yes gene_type:complete